MVNHVNSNVKENDEKGKDERGEKPDVHMFNARSSREGGSHGDVEGREDHEGGEVEGDDGLQVLAVVQVVGGLVDDVHQDGGQVGDAEDGPEVSPELHLNNNRVSGLSVGLKSDCQHPVLAHSLQSGVTQSDRNNQ